MGDINLKAALGGQIVLTPTNTASNYTATFPAVTGVVSVQASASYTTGSVLFVNSSGQIAQNNSQFFWDNTNNRLGIGTSSPTQKFETYAASGYAGIFNSASASIGFNPASSAIIFGTGSLAAYGQGNIDAASLVFKLSGTQAMTLDASGNLGVGTPSPATSIDVRGVASIMSTGVDGTFAPFINATYSANTAYYGAIQHSMSSVATSSGFRFLGGGTSNNTGVSGLQKMLDLTRGQTIFYTGDTERARITSGGLFNINIPTGTPVQRLNVYDAGNSNQMLIYGLNQGSIQFGTYNAGSATGGFILGRSISTNNANDFFLFDAVATAARWQVDTAGNFSPGADNAYTCGKSGSRWSAIWAANGTIQTSDLNAKTDIIPSPLGLSFINQLNPVAYKFKVGGNIPVKHDGEDTTTIVEPIPGKRQHFGLIAQEVKAVLPATVDFGGWVQTDLSDADSEQGLRYEEFISPMIKAIQELSAKLDAAEARIASLEGAK